MAQEQPVVAILGEPGTFGELAQALGRAGAQVLVTKTSNELLDADGMIIPGHTSALETYRTVQSFDAERVVGRRVAGGRPVLFAGAAFGMLFETMDDTTSAGTVEINGIGEWPGHTCKLAAAGAPLGVQQLVPAQESSLLHNLPGALRYKAEDGVLRWEFEQNIDYMRAPAVSWTQTTPPYIAAVENGPLTAVQFCPIASGEPGEEFMRRWVASLPVTGRMSVVVENNVEEN